MSDTQQQIADRLNELELTIDSKFIPFSQSRNKDENDPSLNWKVTLFYKGKDFLTFDYTAGCGHCPAYKKVRPERYKMKIVRQECERGVKVLIDSGRETRDKILPSITDIYCGLTIDIDVIDYGGFEDWASCFGYDSDSRKAKAIYDACLDSYVKTRSALGETLINELRELFIDY